MKIKLTVVYSLFAVAILGLAAAAFAASSATDVRKANTGAAFGSANAVKYYAFERVLKFNAAASTTSDAVGPLAVSGDAGDYIQLADVPAGFKCTNAYWTPGKAEGETATAGLLLGSTTLVAATGINMNGTAGTPQVLTVVNLAPTTAEATLSFGPGGTNVTNVATGTLTVIGFIAP